MHLSKTDLMVDLHKQNFFPTESIGRHTIEKGYGSVLFDHDGNRLIDFSAGLGCLPFGYSYKPTIDLIQKQAMKLIHTGSEAINQESIDLTSVINEVLSENYSYFFSNSGAEANEAALKLARKYYYDKKLIHKTEFISLKNSFHGRTFLNISLSGNSKHLEGFGEPVSNIKQININDLDALEKAVNSNTCAIIIEIMQGKGGGTIIKKDFLDHILLLKLKYDFLLIVDEIQTGLGRLGYMFGFNIFNIKPDIFTLAKGLGGGIPIGLTIASNHISKSMSLGTHGSTFGGNPLACKVAKNIILTLTNENIMNYIISTGVYIKDKLYNINQKFNCFSEINGAGLMLSVTLTGNYEGLSQDIYNLSILNGLVVRTGGCNIIRFTPALNIPLELVDEAFLRFEQVFLEFSLNNS